MTSAPTIRPRTFHQVNALAEAFRSHPEALELANALQGLPSPAAGRILKLAALMASDAKTMLQEGG